MADRAELPSMPVSPAHVMDLGCTVERLRERLAEMTAVCRAEGAGWGPVQEARWEGHFKELMGALHDELDPLLDSWEKGRAHWRKTEALLDGRSSTG